MQAIPFKVRAWAGLLIFYGVGLTSLLALGPVGSGRMFLFAFAILASLLLGLRAGIIALALNISTFFSLGWLLSIGQLHWPHISIQAAEKWTTTSFTFFLLNTVGTVSLGVLVAGLERNLKKEQLLAKKLKESNELLEKENSERRFAEESLRRSNDRFRIVSEMTSDFSYSFRVDPDKNLTLEWTTEAISRITGFETSELSSVGGWENLIYTDDKDIKNNQLKTLIAGQAGIAEYRILSKKGEVRWLLDHGCPLICESSKRVKKIYGAVQDITDRKQAIAALRESEEKYRRLIDNADTAIFIAQDEIIHFPNPKTLEMVDYSEAELSKMPFIELIHPEDRELVIERHRRRLKGETPPSTYSFRIISKNGKEIWAQLNTASISWEGRPATLNFLRDITEHKKLETQLQHAQKMEAIGTLAGGVAHDLNNILSGLVSYPEILLLELPEESPLRDSISVIQDSGQKAAAIVQDLLTLARRGVSISKVVNLNQIVDQYLVSPEHKKILSFHQGVEIQTNLSADLCNILGSSVHLSKTIMNLVSNASEAMPIGGVVSISTESIYVDTPIFGYEKIDEGEYVVLTVSDEGTGISPVEIGKMFEPFYTKKVMGRSGTGLGMAVVWGTVKDHSGFIDVQSTVGKGTTFTMYFPITRKEKESHKDSVKIEEYMGNGESILVVDDVQTQRAIATRMLNKIGYNATSVASGEEAIDYLKEKNADLLVLDMIMEPGIDGLETFKRILEIHSEQKALIASGFSETNQVKEVQGIGAGSYLKKPYSLETIGLAVQTELRR
jgi:PAS domain S-box-containing protein